VARGSAWAARRGWVPRHAVHAPSHHRPTQHQCSNQCYSGRLCESGGVGAVLLSVMAVRTCPTTCHPPCSTAPQPQPSDGQRAPPHPLDRGACSRCMNRPRTHEEPAAHPSIGTRGVRTFPQSEERRTSAGKAPTPAPRREVVGHALEPPKLRPVWLRQSPPTKRISRESGCGSSAFAQAATATWTMRPTSDPHHAHLHPRSGPTAYAGPTQHSIAGITPLWPHIHTHPPAAPLKTRPAAWHQPSPHPCGE
jgi:hypothetical protein